MSGRSSTAAAQAEWAKEVCRPVHLLEADFDPVIYLTDAGTNLTWNNQTYLASKYLGFSGVDETSAVLINTCTVFLSGVESDVVALLLQETYLNRRIRIRTAMLREDLSVISDPTLIFDGRMNRPKILNNPDDGEILCSVEGTSIWADFERRRGRHTNDAEQQKLFPGDRGFAQVAVIPESIFWGIRQELDNLRGANDGRRRKRR